jgi:surface protein
MSSILFTAISFEGDISRWDVSRVTSMASSFSNMPKFRSDLSSWKTSSLQNLNSAFLNSTAFDSDLGNWDVSHVTDMYFAFTASNLSSGDLSSWDVSQVVNMYAAFAGTPWNGDISAWNVSNVMVFYGMFLDAKLFNQSLCAWGDIVSPLADVTGMFQGTACLDTSSPELSAVAMTQQLKYQGPWCTPCDDY